MTLGPGPLSENSVGTTAFHRVHHADNQPGGIPPQQNPSDSAISLAHHDLTSVPHRFGGVFTCWDAFFGSVRSRPAILPMEPERDAISFGETLYSPLKRIAASLGCFGTFQVFAGSCSSAIAQDEVMDMFDNVLIGYGYVC